MALKHLGEEIDIHGGGNDLIFPHHENEIAQSESYSGKPFARYWMHNGMLQLSGEKMSKSLGNLVTIDDFLAKHEPDVLRLLILGSQYRKPLAFNDAVIEDNERGLARLHSALRPATGNDRARCRGGCADHRGGTGSRRFHRVNGRRFQYCWRVGIRLRAGDGCQSGARCRGWRRCLQRGTGCPA